jgi:general secretion pathway protein K
MKRTMTLQLKQRGAALIIAMLLTALGAAVAAQLIAPLAGWMKREYTSRDVQAAYTLADAATAWSLTVLAGDARLSQIDHYGELWATKLPATQVEGGTIEGQIRDLQSRFNLNNLAPAGVKSAANVALAKALFAAAKVPLNLVDTLADAMDRDDMTDKGQSERQSYGNSLPNAPMTRWSDLLAIPGFTDAHLAALAEITEILPDASPININTVEPAFFTLAFPQAGNEAIGKVIAARTTRPFNSVADLSALLGVPVPEGVFATTTRYFSMDATIRFEHAAHRLQLRVVRVPGSTPQVLSRTITNA